MREIDPGHIYEMREIGSDNVQRITFRKASSGSIQHPEEWAGISTQELYRVAIARTLYLDDVRSCHESVNAIYHSRMALWEYEARAYRRKIGRTNKEGLDHDDSERNRPWRNLIANDVPFGLENMIDGKLVYIEDLPIGDDGHIITTPFEKD